MKRHCRTDKQTEKVTYTTSILNERRSKSLFFNAAPTEMLEDSQLPAPSKLPDIWSTVESAGVNISDMEVLILDTINPESNEENEVELEPAKKKRRHFKRSPFTREQKQILFGWLNRARRHPYPTTAEKEKLMQLTGLSKDQINVWFTNHRIRQGLSNSSYHSIHTKKLDKSSKTVEQNT